VESEDREGSNDPYLFSTKNFTGRQAWVFDPEAGTPEERALKRLVKISIRIDIKSRSVVIFSGECRYPPTSPLYLLHLHQYCFLYGKSSSDFSVTTRNYYG